MSIIGSYNGASIISFPTYPAPRQIELGMNDSVAINRSPFTGSTQASAWPGADAWDASIALPKLQGANLGKTDAAVWSAFLAETRGMLNVFFLHDSNYTGAQGSCNGTPLVNGAQSPMATSLVTRGWTPSSFRLLLPGDYLQLGNRLHRVLDVVDSDASGNATISIWPSLRDALTDGETVNLNNPQGLFRLATNRRSLTADETRLSAVTLKCVEAR